LLQHLVQLKGGEHRLTRVVKHGDLLHGCWSKF
jgi:hypothetical protein